MPSPLTIGSRDSRLARLQTQGALDELGRLFPEFSWEMQLFSSPGDQDQATDLRTSPADFFTRHLDQAVLDGRIDAAIHSAKDMPYPAAPGIDWMWLPWREDPRDALVLPAGKGFDSLPAAPRIGVSSDRRETWCRRRFPGSDMKSIRGTIERRLEQLDAGEYDLLIMAVAALNRLGLARRISEIIPMEELEVPEGQGTLGLSFRAGDPRFLKLRRLFVKSVVFAGAGIGRQSASLAVAEALRRCDACLYDTLLDESLLDLIPPTARRIAVGKRSGAHSVPQSETTGRVCDLARQGLRVVRLKGGDPGIFGRLAEETEALETLELPFRVLPGLSTLNVVGSSTGMLLTRRGEARGFSVMTPRQEGGGAGGVGRADRERLPLVLFMAIQVADQVCGELISEGWPATTPAAAVFNAGMEDESIVRSTLAELPQALKNSRELAAEPPPPGLLVLGEPARHGWRRDLGALQGQRVLITGSETITAEAVALVREFGGRPIARPLIQLRPKHDGTDWHQTLAATDWIVVSSPASARCWLSVLRQLQIDLRRIPKILSCGPGTSLALAEAGILADAEPAEAYGSEGILACAQEKIAPGARILRLRSEKAGDTLAKRLAAAGFQVEEKLTYENRRLSAGALPESDIVFFASASAVEAAVAAWGTEPWKQRFVVVIGQPTADALTRLGLKADLIGTPATVAGAIGSLARHGVRQSL